MYKHGVDRFLCRKSSRYGVLKKIVRYIENLDITNSRKNNQNVRYIEVISF